jgi:hypothetical protein
MTVLTEKGVSHGAEVFFDGMRRCLPIEYRYRILQIVKHFMLWEVHLLFGFELTLAPRTCRSSKEGF